MITATTREQQIQKDVIGALVNVHKVIREMCKRGKVNSFFKLSKEAKLTVSASTWEPLSTIVYDDEKVSFEVARMIAFLNMEKAQKMLTGKVELLEAMPVILDGLSELCFERYKIHQDKYDLKMVELLTKRKKVWERVMEYYPTARECIIK